MRSITNGFGSAVSLFPLFYMYFVSDCRDEGRIKDVVGHGCSKKKRIKRERGGGN